MIPICFLESVDEISICVGYLPPFSVVFNAPTDISPYFEIRFHTGASLAEYFDYGGRVVEFLSLSLGVHLKASGIRISRLSSDEMAAAIDAAPILKTMP